MPAQPERPFDGLQVLLVEDNEINREVATAILTRAGIAVTVVENGLEAVASLTGGAAVGLQPYNLVLMDIHMPVMDGYEATPDHPLDTG